MKTGLIVSLLLGISMLFPPGLKADQGARVVPEENITSYPDGRPAAAFRLEAKDRNPNHIGLEGGEYTDAVWVYWTKDLNTWKSADKAVVLDGRNCAWSRKCIGLPSVLKVGNRLATIYDAPGGDSKSHMKRDIGLAWLELPIVPPAAEVK